MDVSTRPPLQRNSTTCVARGTHGHRDTGPFHLAQLLNGAVVLEIFRLPQQFSEGECPPRRSVPCQSSLLGRRRLDGLRSDGVALDGSDQLDLLAGVTDNRSRFLIGELVDLAF